MILNLATSPDEASLMNVLERMAVDPTCDPRSWRDIAALALTSLEDAIFVGNPAGEEECRTLFRVVKMLSRRKCTTHIELMLPTLDRLLDCAPVDFLLPMSIALAEVGLFAPAKLLVAKAYGSDASLRDCYAKLALVHINSPHRENLDIAIALLEGDIEADRIGNGSKLTYALLLALEGKLDTAVAFVESAYDRHPELKDGYGYVGWGGYLRNRDLVPFADFIEKDRTLGRAAVQGKVFTVNMLVASRKTDEAVQLLETLLPGRPNLRNIFASVAWLTFGLGDADACCYLFKRGHVEGKLHFRWLESYAVALAAACRREEAIHQFESMLNVKPYHDLFALGFPASPDAVVSRGQLRELLDGPPESIHTFIFGQNHSILSRKGRRGRAERQAAAWMITVYSNDCKKSDG